MTDPTYRQHLLLESIKQNNGTITTTEDENLDIHWELVRKKYLRNICLLPSGWRFELTEQAEEYLSINNI